MSQTDSPPRMSQPKAIQESSSYKDPSGFVFTQNGKLYRQINTRYKKQYDYFMQSGLYQDLIDRGWLVAHEETDVSPLTEEAYKIIQPTPIGNISYPYEWSFSQLQQAALCTLKIAQQSLKSGMILKDATPFNIQFSNGNPVFIDTLSFEMYREGDPWVAYRQFCETFLSALVLMHYGDESAHGRLIHQIHGIPVKQTSAALPIKSYLNSGVLVHIHFQSWFQQNNKVKDTATGNRRLSLSQLEALLDHLVQTITRLKLPKAESVWGEYYETGVLGNEYVTEKTNILNQFLLNETYSTAIDLGSNNGYFSKMLAQKNIEVVAVDSEHKCIDDLFRNGDDDTRKKILPLWMDITNPSPAIGWMNSERSAFMDRFTSDLVLALALIHHLVIGKNVPFEKVAQLCANMGKHLIIEFIPKTDPKVQLLLAHREDIFDQYTYHHFLEVFQQYFTLQKNAEIPGTGRVLHLFHRK